MLKPSEISRRISEHVTATLANPGVAGAWLESRFPYGAFGLDSPEIEHHGFAIGLVSTDPEGLDRQDPRHGMLSSTTGAIRWAHRVRAEAGVVDVREALDAEVELVDALKSVPGNPRLHVVLLGISRETSRNGLVFVGEVRFQVPHLYPLER